MNSAAKAWHIENGVICKNCRFYRDNIGDFWTSGHFAYCVKQRFGEVTMGRTPESFCDLWEACNDAEGSL